MPPIGKCGGGANQHKQLVTKQQRAMTTTTIPLPEQLLKQPNKSEGESQGVQANNRQAGGEEVADDLRCSIMKSMVVATTNCYLELTHSAVSTPEKEGASNDKDGLPEGESQLKGGEVSKNINNSEAITASSKVE